jgi:hypothetical protein
MVFVRACPCLEYIKLVKIRIIPFKSALSNGGFPPLFLVALPVNLPEKPLVKYHFSLLVQLYSFGMHGSISTKRIKILAFPMYGLDDVCRDQYFLCAYLQAF